MTSPNAAFEPPRPRCGWPHCTAPCEAWIEVHWSIFDFAEYYACEPHCMGTIRWAWHKTVDGMPPLDVDAHWFDEEARGL